MLILTVCPSVCRIRRLSLNDLFYHQAFHRILHPPFSHTKHLGEIPAAKFQPQRQRQIGVEYKKCVVATNISETIKHTNKVSTE